MKRIAHISNGTIANVSLSQDDYTPDGITQMLESDALAAGLTYATRQEEQLPLVVTFRSLAFALRAAGLYAQVKAAALSTEEGEIWWQTAQSTTVQRDHPFVSALAQAVGQTPEQIDTIFAAAAE